MPNRRFYAIIQYNINIVFRVRNMPSFTKYAIKISFMKLLNKKPLSKITVKDIVEDCGINRNSFYYHFSDIPSLIEEIFTEETDKLIQSQTESDTIFDCLLSAIDFAMSVSRWIQCEHAISEYGFLAKHPTTGQAIASPYVSMSQNYMKQVNNLWYQIFQIVKENCSADFSGATPQDDVMERLLRSRRGN